MVKAVECGALLSVWSTRSLFWERQAATMEMNCWMSPLRHYRRSTEAIERFPPQLKIKREAYCVLHLQ